MKKLSKISYLLSFWGAMAMLTSLPVVAAPTHFGGVHSLFAAQNSIGEEFSDAQQVSATRHFVALMAPTAADPRPGYAESYGDQIAARLNLKSNGITLINLPTLLGNRLGLGVSYGAPGMHGPMLNLRWRLGN